MILMFIASGSCSPSSPGDLDVRSGCASVTATRTMIGAKVVMDVVATDCPGDDPDVQADVALRLVEETWRSLRLPVDEVRVRVRGNAADHAEVAVRAELDRRLGPGPRGCSARASAEFG
jgi:hypothetical protein